MLLRLRHANAEEHFMHDHMANELVPHALFALVLVGMGTSFGMVNQQVVVSVCTLLSSCVAAAYMTYNVYATTKNTALKKALAEVREQADAARVEAQALRQEVAKARDLSADRFAHSLQAIQGVNERLLAKIEGLRCRQDAPPGGCA